MITLTQLNILLLWIPSVISAGRRKTVLLPANLKYADQKLEEDLEVIIFDRSKQPPDPTDVVAVS